MNYTSIISNSRGMNNAIDMAEAAFCLGYQFPHPFKIRHIGGGDYRLGAGGFHALKFPDLSACFILIIMSSQPVIPLIFGRKNRTSNENQSRPDTRCKKLSQHKPNTTKSPSYKICAALFKPRRCLPGLFQMDWLKRLDPSVIASQGNDDIRRLRPEFGEQLPDKFLLVSVPDWEQRCQYYDIGH